MSRLHYIMVSGIANQAALNEFAAKNGYEHGPPESYDTFSIMLSATGKEPATHCAARFTSTEGLKLKLDDMKAGKAPTIEGMTKAQIETRYNMLTIDETTSSGDQETDVAYFHKYIKGLGLQLVVSED